MKYPDLYRPTVARVGESFVNYSSVPTSVTTIVAPSANDYGILIWTYFLVPGGGNTSFYADTAAPTGASDTSKRAIFFNTNADRPQLMNTFPLFIEKDNGLYIVSAGAGDRFSLTYDVLMG